MSGDVGGRDEQTVRLTVSVAASLSFRNCVVMSLGKLVEARLGGGARLGVCRGGLHVEAVRVQWLVELILECAQSSPYVR